MNKFIRDGKVAVLVSYGYGAGWFSWNNIEECLFDMEIVDMVLRDASASEIEKRALEKWPEGHWGGAIGLTVEWVPQGVLFRITEYDGYEDIEYLGNQGWITA